MKLIQYFKEHGLKKGLQLYYKDWYKDNKILLWIVIAIILLGVLPIFPSSSTETFKLDVPYTEEDYNRLKYYIETREECNNFYVWDDIEKVEIVYEYTLYQNNPSSREPSFLKSITQEFNNYNIGIFAIKTCDDCIDEKSLSILDEKTCLMNQSSVFGYFEKCQITKESSNWFKYDCIRTPFVISDDLEVVSPDKKFKIEIKPYVTKTKVKGDDSNPVINKYFIEIVITYPNWKPLPYAKWIGTVLLFILDPLKSILKYFTDKWFY